MEGIIKVGIIAILGVLAALWLKGTKPEFAVCIGITLGMFIFGYTVRQLQTMLNGLGQLRELFAGSKGYLSILIKVIGITYLCELFNVFIFRKNSGINRPNQLKFIATNKFECVLTA